MRLQEIIAYLEKVCALVPSLTQECDGIVTTYGPTIIQLIENNADPTTICTKIGLCSNSTAPKSQPPQKVGGAECALCEFVVSELEKLVASNATLAEISAALDHVCEVVPAKYKSECDAFVNVYAPAIIAKLINNEPANLVCEAIKVCVAADSQLDGDDDDDDDKESSLNDAKECALCTWIMTAAENFLAENSTEVEIEDFLSKVCNLAPANDVSGCQDLVSMYTPYITHLLLQDEPPAKICQQLTLCPSSLKPFVGMPLSTECAACEWLMGVVEGWISSNSTEQVRLSMVMVLQENHYDEFRITA